MDAGSKCSNLTRLGRWRWWIHLSLISGYVLFIGASGILWPGRSHGGSPSHPVGGLLFHSAIEMILYGLVFGFAFYASRATPDDLLLRWRGHVNPILLGIGYAIALRLTIGFLMNFLFFVLIATGKMDPTQTLDIAATQQAGADRVVSSAALRSSPAYFWTSLTVTSFIMAGFFEELWRAAFISGLKSLWPEIFSPWIGQVVAVVIAAALFGFGHTTQSPLMVLYAGFLGVGFGLIMIFHRSIWPAVIAHGLFDATYMVMTRWYP